MKIDLRNDSKVNKRNSKKNLESCSSRAEDKRGPNPEGRVWKYLHIKLFSYSKQQTFVIYRREQNFTHPISKALQ